MDDRAGDEGRLSDPAFWRELQATFENALDLLREIAENHGIEPDSATRPEIIERDQELDEEARAHPLSLSAAEYARRVNRWFRRAKARIHEWGRDAARAAELDAVTPELEADVASMQEAVEEIADQRYRIHVKLMRALRERMRSDLKLPTSPEASAAAAVEAYAGVRQSIEMWLRMREFFPEEEDAILNLLVLLENLRQAIAGEFPTVNDRTLTDET